jgi:hypothetical protein
MLRRVDADEGLHRQESPVLGPSLAAAQIVPTVGESESFESLLPRDHPKWVRDAVTVSQRARELIARLRPVAVRILTFWDHRVRSALVGGSRICVDPSGSYRME